ncbi:MAG TPA: hypothetical protein VGZ28_02925 [Terriglobales bacterium]|jgi:hypothetical protein|nr:hypothetical protein [Terriglobales bacterium]
MTMQSHTGKALVERLWTHTVGIANAAREVWGKDPVSGMPAREEESPGTGVAAKWGEHHFILTAKHVLEDAQLANLSFFARPTGSFKEADVITSQDAMLPLPLNDPNSVIHRYESDDLALITLKPDALGPYLEFFDIETEWVDPAVEDIVIGFGFPVSAAKIFQGPKVGNVVPKAVLLLVMPFKGKVLPPTTGRFYGGFDADRHYLILFELAKDGMHPKGISGAATWVKSTDESGLWTPRFKFCWYLFLMLRPRKHRTGHQGIGRARVPHTSAWKAPHGLNGPIASQFPTITSTFFMIRVAQCTAAAIILSVRGLPCGSPNNSSAWSRWRAMRIPAMMSL